MSNSISPSYKGNIVTYKNSRNNSDNDKNSGSDISGDSDNINEGYGAKMIRTQDELGKLVNHETKLVFTSLHIKISTPGLRLGAAICFEFT